MTLDPMRGADELTDAGKSAVVGAINVLSSALPDDEDMEKLSRVLVRLGLLNKCAGCGYVYPIDGSDDYCERRYDDCAACQDGEAHPHWQRNRFTDAARREREAQVQ